MIITIPRAQSLRFVNITSNYPPAVYNHDNTLLQYKTKVGEEPYVYFQKFHTSDNITVQLTTDYQTVTLKVYDCLNAVQQTVTLVDQNAGLANNVKVLQGSIATSGLGGIYYAKLEFSGIGLPAFIYQSEYISIDNYEDYTRIEWRESEYSGLYYNNSSTRFGFRIEADVTNYEPQSESESFDSFNSNIVKLKTTTKRAINLMTDEVPRYIYEKLSLGVAHNKVYVNGVEHVGTDGVKAEKVDGYDLYFVSVSMVEANYEVYTDLLQVSGGISPTNNGLLTANGTNFITFNGTNKAKIY